MTRSRRDTLKTLGAASFAAIVPGSLIAQSTDDDDTPTVHEVQMLNVHPEDRSQRMVFYPDIVRAQPGDTIRFLNADPGHNSEVNEDMMPEGGETWEGRINEEIEVTITTEGAYGYYCTPHQTAGMVGLILVGDVSGNYEAIKDARQRGRARQRYEDIFARADAMLADENA